MVSQQMIYSQCEECGRSILFVPGEPYRTICKACESGPRPAPPRQRPDRPFQVDEELIFHSPYTGEDSLVIYRGGFLGDAVVYSMRSGMQYTVPMDCLRRQASG